MVSPHYETVFDADELAFRDAVEAFVAALPPQPRRQSFAARGGNVRVVFQQLAEHGWLSQCWPVQWGGQGKPISYDFLLWDVLAERRTARRDIGAGLIAHAFITHGSPEQHERILPELAAGRLAVALGYSEPEAGSDLTHLRTRATRQGDSYVVNGQKIWTSDAEHANRLWLLCRTGARDSGRHGLTLLFMELDSPGVTVTPIETMAGHPVNEVFLDDVVVPVSARVGAEGEAWTIVCEALAVERHTQVLPGRLRRDLADLRAALDAGGLGGRPEAERCYRELATRVDVVEATVLTALAEMIAGGAGIAASARAKFLGAELCQAIPRGGLELLGARGVVDDNEMAFLWRASLMETIAGGSVEVMLSLLAREELKLGSGR